MTRITLLIPFLVGAAACTPSENLQGSTLEARVSGTELRFESQADESIVISLRPDGSGTVRDILPPEEGDRVDEVRWNVEGDAICLTSLSRADARRECAQIQIAGNRVTIDGGSEPLVGTIAPL